MSHGIRAGPAAGSHDADPSAITAAGFAAALCLTSIQAAGFITRLDWVGPLALISGIVLLLACVVHLNNGSTLHGTTSGIYGSYWLAISLQIMAATATASSATATAGDAASGVAFPGLMDHLDANLTYLRVPLAIFTLYAILATYLQDQSYLLVYCLFECQLVCLVAGQQAGSSRLMQAGGWFGILSSCLAFYLSASFLLKPFISLPGAGSCGQMLGIPAWLAHEPLPSPRSPAVELSLNPRPRFETSESGAEPGDVEAQGKLGYSSSSSSRRALRLHGHKSSAHLLSFMGRRGAPHSSHLNGHASHASLPKHGSWEGPGGGNEAETGAAEPAQPGSTTMTPSVSTIDFFQRWKVWT